MKRIFLIGFSTLCMTIVLFYIFNFDFLNKSDNIKSEEESDLKKLQTYKGIKIITKINY
jgi:hypothetical protein